MSGVTASSSTDLKKIEQDFHLSPDGHGQKTFVLDTNVLLHNPGALFAFKDNRVVLALAVIEEIDTFKRNNDELGRNARHVIREIDKLRQLGHLGEGVPLGNDGGIFQVVLHQDVKSDHSMVGLKPDAADNQIISVALELNRKGQRVIFVSKDINCRVKADALGLTVMDLEQQKVDYDTLYQGWRELQVSAETINQFYGDKKVALPEVDPAVSPNEFFLLKNESNPKHTAMARADMVGHELVPLTHEYDRAWNIAPRSASQRYAFELLLDDSVQLVTLVGRAGTGKTLMALAAGLQRVIKDKKYEKILVSRPIMPLGRDIGYLPGSKDEKLSAWMGPIFDNLKMLLHGRYSPNQLTREQLFEQDLLELEALTYIRGRSITNMFVIIDEAQNLTPHEVKTIISRVGEGTKMVLTGDPQQIDNPYLDASSNGLTYCVERLKSSELCGHITLTKSERSALAELAADRL